jgi:hypothetical protein
LYSKEGYRNPVQASCRMDMTQLEQHAYILIAILRGRSSVWKGIVPHGLHKLTVTFSSISPSQYGYFDVDMDF